MLPTSNAVPSPPTDLAKLDELEALTKEYSLYSRSAFGLGHLPGSALLVLGLALELAGIHPWGTVIVAAAPWVWLATREPIRRRLYQREGRVTERATEMDYVRLGVGLLLLTFIVVLLGHGTRSAYQDLLRRPDALWIMAAPISALVFSIVACFLVRSRRDPVAWYLIGFCVISVVAPDSNWEKETRLRGLLSTVIWTLLIGLDQHFKYRRLERRLASLRTAL